MKCETCNRTIPLEKGGLIKIIGNSFYCDECHSLATSTEPIPFEPVKQVPKVVAIDVDGFLTNETCWTEEEMRNATPKEDVCKWARKKFDGSFIAIYTARPEKYRAVTKKWLINNDIPYNVLVMGKLPCDEYWDDRAFNLEDIDGS